MEATSLSFIAPGGTAATAKAEMMKKKQEALRLEFSLWAASDKREVG